MGGRSSLSAMSFDSARHTTPPVCRIMKAIFSASTAWAGSTRSPSFSRSSSSTRTTGLPRVSSATRSVTEAKPVPRWRSAMTGLPQREDTFDVLRDQVRLQVDAVTGAKRAQGRDRERVRDERDREVRRRPVRLRTSRAAYVYDGQTDAVYRDAALRDQLTGEPPRRPEAEGAGARREVDAHDLRDAVYVARNEVPAERPSRTHGLLEVHVGAGEPPWNGEPLRLLDQLDPEAAARHSRAVHNGQAAA